MNKKTFKELCSEEQSNNEINLTPLIDTILVLLIIFILLLPQIESSLQILLPKQNSSTNKPLHQDYNRYFCIMIDQHGQIFLKNKIQIHSEDIQKALENHITQNGIPEVIIFADKDILLEKVTNIIDILNTTGIQNIYIKTQK